jgi:squalene-associated FAD-dependent desaturase
MRRLRVAVVGGGWAGLSAAIEATLRGHAVTAFEMAPHWGGRARRVDIDGLALDNGQHILIGAYVQTLRMLRTVGVDVERAFLRTPLRLVDPQGGGLRLPAGPPLLAFVRGVLAHRGWRFPERLGLLLRTTGWALRRFRSDPGMTVAELTRGWPPALRREVIDPMCVAALNTPAEAASASVFLRVMRDALFSGPGGSDLLLPRTRLSELLPVPAVRWLGAQGASLRTSTRVERVERTKGGWAVDGEPFDGVVLATTAVEAARLAGDIAPRWSDVAAALRYEPIVTVYAQSDGTRLPEAMLALESHAAHQPAQFVFDLGQLGGRAGLLAFVISGAQAWIDRGMEATREATLAQGRHLLAGLLRGQLLDVRVLTEKRANFRCVPALRRPPGAIAPGLHAAGDYVDGPYPATLEGGVRAAVEAVQGLEKDASPER